MKYERDIINILIFYLCVSMVFWVFRFSLGFDCEKRYIDYLFPLTKLHCPINPEDKNEKAPRPADQ